MPRHALRPRGRRQFHLFLRQFTSPIELILIGATVLSMVLGEVADGFIILTIVMASGLLGFGQERRAGREIDALLAHVRIHADVIRDGVEVEVVVDDVVVGDLVILRAGDVVPADALVVEAHDLFLDESALTGESFAVEKFADRDSIFFGTHVTSGMGRAVVTATGADTTYGILAADVVSRDVTTRFERGLNAFGLLLVRAMVILVSVIFVVNVFADRPVVDSLLFSLALAVGLTPQMLPAIVAVSLATGAHRMADEKVVVKRLDVIEDFGTMTILCTDKTGTLTTGAVRLDAALALDGYECDEVRELAHLNAGLQRGFANPLDLAILAGAEAPDPHRRLDEIPYDFRRRRLSVLVDRSAPLLVTKGAFREVVEVCSTARFGHEVVPIGDAHNRIAELFERLSGEGFRVLAVAVRELPGRSTIAETDESDLTLCGLLAFADPPKSDAAAAISELADLGVEVKMITGDNRHAALHVARSVGLLVDTLVTGDEIAAMDDATLARRARETQVFAEVDPVHKERIVRSLRSGDTTVGYLGDGINDAAALHAAEVAMSVDTAVDVAKQAASIVLLDKDLHVVVDGVRIGRRTFANTMKYVRVTTSANFGNMLSMAAAAVFLPFLPLLPRQILLLNFLSDVPGMTIAVDAVDDEQIARPHNWDIASIRRFMIVFGLVSYVFDLATFAVLRAGFDADAEQFRTTWFLVSTTTELTALLVLRSARPFWRSHPSRRLVAASLVVAAMTIALPFSPFASAIGLIAPSIGVLVLAFVVTVAYALVNESVKWRSGLFS